MGNSSPLIFNSEEKGKKRKGNPEKRERKAGSKMQLTAVLWGALITLLLSHSSGKETLKKMVLSVCE